MLPIDLPFLGSAAEVCVRHAVEAVFAPPFQNAARQVLPSSVARSPLQTDDCTRCGLTNTLRQQPILNLRIYRIGLCGGARRSLWACSSFSLGALNVAPGVQRRQLVYSVMYGQAFAYMTLDGSGTAWRPDTDRTTAMPEMCEAAGAARSRESTAACGTSVYRAGGPGPGPGSPSAATTAPSTCTVNVWRQLEVKLLLRTGDDPQPPKLCVGFVLDVIWSHLKWHSKKRHELVLQVVCSWAALNIIKCHNGLIGC